MRGGSGLRIACWWLGFRRCCWGHGFLGGVTMFALVVPKAWGRYTQLAHGTRGELRVRATQITPTGSLSSHLLPNPRCHLNTSSWCISSWRTIPTPCSSSQPLPTRPLRLRCHTTYRTANTSSGNKKQTGDPVARREADAKALQEKIAVSAASGMMEIMMDGWHRALIRETRSREREESKEWLRG